MTDTPDTRAESIPQERWLPVVGCDRPYEVSDMGRVRSLDHTIVSITQGREVRKRVRGRTLKPALSGGYPKVCIPGRGAQCVHTLILEAFVGPRPAGHEACHWDGERANSVLTNLRWGTRKENRADARRHGRVSPGPQPGQAPGAKLTEDGVRDIRAALLAGETGKSIAETYGVTPACISRLKRGETWGHVPDLEIARDR